jgi:nifR3 family TIM-barrel protein
MNSFWETLPRPFFALAPMEDVTDAAFRRIIAEYGKPDVTWTEFTSADGLVLAHESGKKKLLRKLAFSALERPVVAQLFSAHPEHMEAAARIAAQCGVDGIDINMGCPDKKVEKQGSGAALIKNAPLARELIRAVKRGAPGIPVSVKTRVGYSSDDELEEWLSELLACNIAALTVHARTRNNLSDVPARWELVRRAVALRDQLSVRTLIIGNGDVSSRAEGLHRVAETGCDGIMIGRGVFGNPWVFTERNTDPTPRERIIALMRHLELFEDLVSDVTNYAVMKKHFKAYIHGWNHAKDVRMQLMETDSVEAAREILANTLVVLDTNH